MLSLKSVILLLGTLMTQSALADALNILKKVVGKIDKFPVEQ